MQNPDAGVALALEDGKSVCEALQRLEAHPHDPSAREGVECIQTHLSWVFLTRERVYKLRKPVSLGFVDFSTRAERNRDCLREVALNRRLAPDVYLGVAAVRPGPNGPWVGPPVENTCDEFEHCVVMRRLPGDRDALSLLRRGALDAAHVDAIAQRIARFHGEQKLGVPAPFSPEVWRARQRDPLHACVEAIQACESPVVSSIRLDRCAERARAFEAAHAARFEARRVAGRAVDGHGDLHLDHVWFEAEGGEPIAIDCLEFDEALRRIDAASEVAFLAMDLRYREADALAERFLSSYAAETDDYGLYDVVDYFIAYRALVRAKVAALASRDPGIAELQRENAAVSARRHVELADSALDPGRRGCVVAVGGAVGTGKTTVASLLGETLGAAVISSDRVRKQLLGLAATDRAPAAAYEAEARSKVYGALCERARRVLASGRPVVLDATFGCAGLREAVRALARHFGVPADFLEVRCDPRIAMQRLERRRRAGRSASDAGPELHAASRIGFEPPLEWPAAHRAVVETDRSGWRQQVARLAERLSEQRWRPSPAGSDP